MTWQSRVPQVLDALVTRWRTSPDLSGIVRDGPVPVENADLEVLSVGHDSDMEGTATQGNIAIEGYGTRPNREQFSVTCLIAVLNGASEMGAARQRAFELLSIAGDTLTADVRLGGVVMQASIDGVALSQLQVKRGALARLFFTVSCDAYTAT